MNQIISEKDRAGIYSVDNLDRAAIAAKKDKRSREELLQNQEEYILKCVRKAAGRYITKSDDEWSVALLAFSEAIDGYAPDKGSFSAYAYTVIRSRQIDHIRKQKKRMQEIPASPAMLDGEYEDAAAEYSFYRRAPVRELNFSENRLRDEIEALNHVLEEYEISFPDLVSCSPKTEKTRKQCRMILMNMQENEGLRKLMRKTHQLPVAEVVIHTGLHRKIIERYRKYIIAATEILAGDYPELREYIPLPAQAGGAEGREET